MKLTTQTAVVACVGIVATTALILGLAVWADMDDGALIGLATAAGAILGNLVMQLRASTKLTAQDRTLDTIVAQTNGLSDLERQDIAERVAQAMIAKLRSEGKL